MLAHISRQFKNHSNENIDPHKNDLNYTFNRKGKPARLDGLYIPKKRYEEICSRVKIQNRKDVNTLVSVCLHAPQDIQPEEEERFFEIAHKFLKQRYCQNDNFVAAVVHRDENRPHLHFVFVPVVEDKKKNRLKVCAKEVITRADLKTLHKDLSDRLQEVFGRDMKIYSPPPEMPSNDLKTALKRLMNKTPPKQFKALIDDFRAVQAAIKQFEQLNEKVATENTKLREEYQRLNAAIEELKKNELYNKFIESNIADFVLEDDFPTRDDFER